MSDKGVPLFVLAFSCPLIGVRQRWPNVLHAVEVDGLPIKTWPKGTARSVCGKTGVRVLMDGDTLVPWPPYVKGLGEKVRCSECFEKCPKKKPVARFKEPA